MNDNCFGRLPDETDDLNDALADWEDDFDASPFLLDTDLEDDELLAHYLLANQGDDCSTAQSELEDLVCTYREQEELAEALEEYELLLEQTAIGLRVAIDDLRQLTEPPAANILQRLDVHFHQLQTALDLDLEDVRIAARLNQQR